MFLFCFKVSGDDAGDDDNVSEISNLSGLSEEEWRPTSGKHVFLILKNSLFAKLYTSGQSFQR